MRYMVVIEKGIDSFGAHVPDLPGCIAAAHTKQEVMELIREAIAFHLEGVKEDGAAVPQPCSFSEFVEVHA
ncbi:MAG: Predicted nuclease of the RNAse H fold, HicB family [Candidatus Kentron sp. G]|nr:MAG: Predicted nuclease of the RNAse H fold, HicB family [Candidatus Kentron sp. G]VFN01213.1 MAG: Predicted nuclease of the RNAse H fold, HicB family [Candidatus Kentron sp. G]VFN02125.1 MAG: Predicted nuclease of the RNAse H fold, HicB family [Candidatus Kentron sp. G]